MKHLVMKCMVVALAIATTGAKGPSPSRTEQAMRSLGFDSPAIAEIAEAIDQATKNRQERILLASVAWHETRYKEPLAHCRAFGDSGKAAGPWQTWALKCPATVSEFASEAIRHLRSTGNYCGGQTAKQKALGAVSLYATGKTCRWAGASKRWATMVRLARVM